VGEEQGVVDPGALRAAIAAGMPWVRDELARLVTFRSVFNPAIEPVEQCEGAAAAVADLVRDTGFEGVETLTTQDGSLAICARSGRPGSPSVLLYSHHDVVPAGDLDAWDSDPWRLTERDGRWFARGAADCKGNLLAVLLALRAVRDVLGEWPLEVALVVEGSEEQSSGGMEALARARPELVAADAIVIADTGNIEAGLPTLTTSLRGTGSVIVTVSTMEHAAHSGMFGGAAPDALQALLMGLASLRDATGETTIDGLDHAAEWDGAPVDPERFARDVAALDGVAPLGDPAAIADRLWARPAATVLAIDVPSVAQVTASVQGQARAVVNLRVPADTDSAVAQRLLIEHLERHIPWGQVEIRSVSLGQGFRARTDGPAHAAMQRAMAHAFGVEPVATGQGGSIPLTVALAELHPDAEIMLLGVEEPACRIHATNESVDPLELERTAYALALFLCDLGT
jgi:acetylornithine deacetylase/succinyl-diaminopimelate desuccinylase-like protein